MTEPLLTARSSFDLPLIASGSPSVAVTVRDGLAIASVNVRRAQRAALAEQMSANFGISLPDGARREAVGSFAIAGLGPGTWLVTSEDADEELASSLMVALGDSATVVDQSGAYAITRLSGIRLRESLAELVPLDLHPRDFGVGRVAGTLLGHIGVWLWRLEDGNDGFPIYEIAVYRSLAGSLRQELSHLGQDRAI